MVRVPLDILFDGDMFVTDCGVFRATRMTMVEMTARYTDMYDQRRWYTVITADGVDIRYKPCGYQVSEIAALSITAEMWKNERSMAAGAAADFTEEAYLSRWVVTEMQVYTSKRGGR